MTPIGLELCDLCHDWQPIRKIYFDGKRFYCRKCREEKPKETICAPPQVR